MCVCGKHKRFCQCHLMPPRDVLEALYLKHGSIDALAKARGVYRDSVRAWLKHYGLKSRSKKTPIARQRMERFADANRGKTLTLAQIYVGASVSLTAAKYALVELVAKGKARRVGDGRYTFIGLARADGRQLRKEAGWPPLEKWESKL